MKELIFINVGGAGVNIGSKIWQNLTKQHSINYQGQTTNQQSIYNHHSIFSQTSAGRYVPRNIFIDNDGYSIDEVKKGYQKDLFNHKYCISGKQDTANNYLRGNWINRIILQDCQDSIRKLMQNCDYLQGIVFNYSLSGGTGSSMTKTLFNHLQYNNSIKKKTVILNTLLASPHISDTVVQPYNVVMGLGQIIDIGNSNSIFLAYDNQKLYKYSQKQDIKAAHYNQINQYIAKTTCILTNNIRVKLCNFSLSQITMNTVPYKKANILTPSLSSSQLKSNNQQFIDQFYSKTSQLNSYSIPNQKMMGSYGAFRGQIDKFQLMQNMRHHRRDQSYVQYCPNPLKINISQKQLGKSITEKNHLDGVILRNSTGILNFFRSIHSKYQRIYQKRAYVHWYVGQGISSDSFDYPRQVTLALQADYQQMMI